MIRHEKLYDRLDGNHRIEEIAGATSARKLIMQPQLLRQEAFTRREGEKLTTSTRENNLLVAKLAAFSPCCKTLHDVVSGIENVSHLEDNTKQ